MRDEIREYLSDRKDEAFFVATADETIRIMDSKNIETAVINLQRIEDAAILRYINLNYQRTRVLLMPGRLLKEVIPALASGHYELLQEPFRLEELRKML